MDRRLIRNLAVWLAAAAVAFALDARVAAYVHQRGIDAFLQSHKILREGLKAPGFFLFTLIIVIPLVIWLHGCRWRAGLFTFLGTAVSGSNQVVKWIAGRTRPFKPMDGSHRLVPFEVHPFPAMGTPNLCFPSGHAALAFATAAVLGILWPRFRQVFWAAAVIVAAERVCENAHWLSDTVAAAALGIGGVKFVQWIWWNRPQKRAAAI